MPRITNRSKPLHIALDTETTGVDFKHGAKPYLVTIYADDEGRNVWWEWDVDPMTREPMIPDGDLDEIQDWIDRAELIVLQNGVFDVLALMTIMPDLRWDWGKVRDTLLDGHLLTSNQPKDLTALALRYLGVNIAPYETAVEKATKAARNAVRRKEFIESFGAWAIAREGRPDMPSAKGGGDRAKSAKQGKEATSPWKFDMWLPRALRKADTGWPEEWDMVTADYANADTAVTLPIHREQEKEIRRRGLEKISAVRLKLLPVSLEMQETGITANRDRLETSLQEYRAESAKAGRLCVNIARSYGYNLEMPKAANNNSLRHFCFGRPVYGESTDGKKSSRPVIGVEKFLDLPVAGTTKTGQPSLDVKAMEKYSITLPERSKQKTFIRALADKRKRDTAISYMESYKKFWLPLTGFDDWMILYPSLNPTATDTLRWSSQNPNEQNISKKEGFNLRAAFGPDPDHEWWSMDAQNIELRLPAYESGEKELIELFEHPSDPPYYGSTHLLNFHTVYPEIWDKELAAVGIEKVGPHCKKKYASTWYQWCKNGGFAVQYGAVEREEGTADIAFHRPGSHSKLKARFSRLEKLNQKCIRFAERCGYVETMPDREVDPERGYPLMCTRTDFGRILPTVPLNYRVQGSAMWWMMKAMIRCAELLERWRADEGFDARIILQVHDELVFRFPRRADPRTDPERSNLGRVRALKAAMERGGDDLRVPTPVSVEYHPNSWAEGFSIAV